MYKSMHISNVYIDIYIYICILRRTDQTFDGPLSLKRCNCGQPSVLTRGVGLRQRSCDQVLRGNSSGKSGASHSCTQRYSFPELCCSKFVRFDMSQYAINFPFDTALPIRLGCTSKNISVSSRIHPLTGFPRTRHTAHGHGRCGAKISRSVEPSHGTQRCSELCEAELQTVKF